MSDPVPTERTLGNLDARMTIMEGRVTRIELSITQRLGHLEASLDEVHEAVISARGAWRAVLWLGGASGTIAAALFTIIHWFVPKA